MPTSLGAVGRGDLGAPGQGGENGRCGLVAEALGQCLAAAPQWCEDGVDVLLGRCGDARERAVGLPERLQPGEQVVELERLDQVVRGAGGGCGAYGVRLARGGHHHHADVVPVAAEPAQHVDPADVGQVHVEEDEVRREARDLGEGGLTGCRHTQDPEALGPFDEARVDRGHHEVVVHHQHGELARGHDAPGCRGSRAVNTAPSALWTDTEPVAALAHDLHERQADAATARVARLGGVAAPEDLGVRRAPRARSRRPGPARCHRPARGGRRPACRPRRPRRRRRCRPGCPAPCRHRRTARGRAGGARCRRRAAGRCRVRPPGSPWR